MTHATVTTSERQRLEGLFLVFAAETGILIYEAAAAELVRSHLPQFADPGSDVHDHLPRP